MKPAAALAACLLLSGCATASVPVGTPTPLGGYLETGALDAVVAGVRAPPPAPSFWPGDLQPAVEGKDRWWLATAQAELRPPEAGQHFDCILGTRLAGRPRPALTRLMTRLLADSEAVTRRLGELHPRPRPMAVHPGLETCQRADAATRESPSWPAAGAVAGAVFGEMFAALAPDQAEALKERGRDIGRSRSICRMNWSTDVEDGHRVGRRVYVSATEAPDFLVDLDAARAEIVAARAEGLTNPGCAAERRALAPGAVRLDEG